jgi:glutamate racemase
MDNRPIGAFDSGLGGLTVLKEIMKIMPNESIVYLADSGRAPYGTKSKENIIKYTFQDVRFLISQNIKMLVIACNTASAYGYEKIKSKFDIPIVEIVQPGAITAARETRSKKVGLIATPATIGSAVYEKTIKKIDSSIEVVSKACPLFVPLVEEGWWENDIALKVAEQYLTSIKEEAIDTLVMGCTHYPLLQNVISRIIDKDIRLVNPAPEAARFVKKLIVEKGIAKNEKIKPVYRYFTSDNVEKFRSLASIILDRDILFAEKVDIEKY